VRIAHLGPALKNTAPVKRPDTRWQSYLSSSNEVLANEEESIHGLLQRIKHVAFSGNASSLFQSNNSPFSRNNFASSRNIGRVPPRSALGLDICLPWAVLGPVECSHGFQF
jgi:hypothetical protein